MCGEGWRGWGVDGGCRVQGGDEEEGVESDEVWTRPSDEGEADRCRPARCWIVLSCHSIVPFRFAMYIAGHLLFSINQGPGVRRFPARWRAAPDFCALLESNLSSPFTTSPPGGETPTVSMHGEHPANR